MSNLLSQASLVMIPSGYKEDVVYSPVPTDGSGDLSFTRAGNGTRTNSAGLVEVCPWNLVQQSNTFSNATWTKGSSITVTGGQTGYDGSSNAWLLSKGAIQYSAIGQSLANSGFATFSIYAKANTNTNICLFQGSSPSNFFQDFNLSNGTLGTNAAGVVSASITSVGNGWYFCVVTFNGNTTTVDIFPDIIDGTSAGSVYIQNAQLNIGSTAKPYFPTTDRLNVPRLTYQNGGGGCPSLLLEKQSTNILLYSEQFDNAGWSKLASSVTANSTTSPDGTQNADTNTVDTSSNEHGIAQVLSIASGFNTISVYLKPNGATAVRIGFANDDFGGMTAAQRFAYFDLSNGTVLQSISGGTTTIQNVGNGWYRCIVTQNLVSGSSGGAVQILLTQGTTTFYTGNGTDGVFMWDAQLEASSYPTSYIPTTSASATRVADFSNTSVSSSLLPQASGTMFVQFDWQKAQVDSQIFSIHNNGTNLVWIAKNSTTQIQGTFFMSAFIGTIDYTLLSTAGLLKVAYAWTNGSQKFYINGVEVGSANATISSSPMLNWIQLNGFWGINKDGCEIQEAVLFPTKLTDAELAQLTA